MFFVTDCEGLLLSLLDIRTNVLYNEANLAPAASSTFCTYLTLTLSHAPCICPKLDSRSSPPCFPPISTRPKDHAVSVPAPACCRPHLLVGAIVFLPRRRYTSLPVYLFTCLPWSSCTEHCTPKTEHCPLRTSFECITSRAVFPLSTHHNTPPLPPRSTSRQIAIL